MSNALYYGDNLGYLREMDRESVDLIYLDPPFNSKSTYNLLFRSPQGGAVQAQTTAFKDTWFWDNPAEKAFDDVLASGSPASGIMRALRSFLGESDLMAYLAMMGVRLIELRRVLKQTGSLYLHCDPTASHYLKLLLDGAFGPGTFINEIVWERTNTKSHAYTRFSSSHDVILSYGKGETHTWNPAFLPHADSYIKSHYGNIDKNTGRRYTLGDCLNPNPDRPNLTYEWNGTTRVWRWTKEKMQAYHDEGRLVYTRTGMPRFKRYLDEMAGTPLSDVWTDIFPINSQAQERLGYPTQKPLVLLEGIISASSNEGDVILDPFCGCGTTIEAAEELRRKWIGIDITHHAIDVIEGRLRAKHPDADYLVNGRPEEPDAARKLAKDHPYEFQWWANWRLGVQNYREHKKGPDKGIDGIIYFHNPPHGVGQTIISVKAGQHIDPGMISALEGTIKREDAQLGVFVCAASPSLGMRRNAATMGIVRIGREQYPRIQIVTAEELINGPFPQIPRPIESEAFQQPLRPSRPTKAVEPQPQLSFALPIAGLKQRRPDVQDHFSGQVLGKISAAQT